MLPLYRIVTRLGGPVFRGLLHARQKKGKEHSERLPERMGQPSQSRPEGKLLWLHAASVGEVQSALILLEALLKAYPGLYGLVTTGTVTSAALLEKRLPDNATHQFYPLDHPDWVQAFLDHWRPDAALWMESELWPNMLSVLQERSIPAALVNARLSSRSFQRWKGFPKSAKRLLDTFSVCLTQTEKGAEFFEQLGAENVQVTDNLKYAAAPLPFDETALKALQNAADGRPLWLYASTHKGEEEMACRLHKKLRESYSGLLTIIVPRHPERGEEIKQVCQDYRLTPRLRGPASFLPEAEDDIYIADTLGELGLFYRLAPVACIGRSFSLDGGGGHNPIEAAQLGCAVLHGPHVQNLQSLYDDAGESHATLPLRDEIDFEKTLSRLLSDSRAVSELQDRALLWANGKADVLKTVLMALGPLMKESRVSSCP